MGGHLNSDFEEMIIQADKGVPGAQDRLWAEMERTNMDDDHYIPIRTNLYKRLAKQGDAFAEVMLGDLADVEGRPQEALQWYLQAASKGNAEAMYNLGMGYSSAANESGGSGREFGYDPVKSFQWFEKSANSGYLKSFWHVASSCADGEGTEKSREAEYLWAKRGADMGSADCCLYLADFIYSDPSHPRHNEAEAVHILEKAMTLKDRSTFERAARKLGNIFGASYLYNTPANQFTNQRKSAYCFTLAYVLDSDSNDVSRFHKTGYRLSQEEFECWRSDAINLQYNAQIR